MAEIIKYNLASVDEDGTVVQGPECSMPYSAENLALAQSEAYGEVSVEEDGTSPVITRDTVTAAMRKACADAITGGVDVTLDGGRTCHFSLTLEDQLNLMNLQSMADAGAAQLPYHADGENCRYYSPEELHTITQAATRWKMYQESYFNSLRGYIASLETQEQLEAVRYGMEIPEPFRTDVLRQMEGAL